MLKATVFKSLTIIPFICFPLHAEITTDGSLGNRVNLNAPDYQITQDLGKRVGDNLFHSFDSFNIYQGESATFSGDKNISNVISRVTGGKSSTIDGVFRNTISNSDTYFINPAGVLFGKNAQLDVQGSFHVSTADYLRLGENEKFYANLSENSVLSVDSPSAFGFLNNSASPISIQGRGKVFEVNRNEISDADWDKLLRQSKWKDHKPKLIVPEGKILSLIGGILEFKNGSFLKAKYEDGYEYIENLSDISVPSGRINLIAVDSLGEVKLGSDFVDVSSFSQLSDIYLTENSYLSTDGKGGGRIFIRGNQFVANHSRITNNTSGNKDGGIIDIRVDEISLNNLSGISADTFDKGNAGAVFITANDIFLKDVSVISSAANNKGNAGQISINANDIFLSSYSRISSATNDEGNAGAIFITANGISLNDDSWISSSTWSIWVDEGGNAGTISIDAHDIFVNDSKISTESGDNAGLAGEIIIKANRILLTSGGSINTSTKNARGGNVDISSSNILYLKGGEITTSVQGGGKNSGNITLKPKFIVLDNGRILAQAFEGKGGNVNINATGIYKFPPESNNLIDASSKLGIDGEVKIDSPGVDVSSGLFILFNEFIDIESLIKDCGKKFTAMMDLKKKYKRDGFTVHYSSGSVPSPDDFQGSSVLPISTDNKQLNFNKKKQSVIMKISCSKE